MSSPNAERSSAAASSPAQPVVTAPPRATTSFVGGVVLSYLLAITLLATLIEKAGIWNVLANTRVLDFAIEVGIIRYHDLNMGLVDGVADQKYYLMSQDPIDYRILALAAGVYVLYWMARAWKFHLAARFVGATGTRSQHMRARLMGMGVGRFIPFGYGAATTETILVSDGATPAAVHRTFALDSYLTLVFQIGLFWILGLFVTDFNVWMEHSFWALLICGASFYVARAAGLLPWGRAGARAEFVATSRALFDRPSDMARLGGLSALTMLLDDLTPFLLAMAFTGEHVIMNVPFIVIQLGVLAGYIATRFEITPHGIGQREWAFALTLYAAGVGFPEAATIALLEMALRHLTGFLIHMVIRYKDGPPRGDAAATYFGPLAPAEREVPVVPADAPLGGAA